MKVNVKQDVCIGCGACASICPEVFELNDEGVSTAKVEDVPEENKDKVTDAKESCPVGAIETK